MAVVMLISRSARRHVSTVSLVSLFSLSALHLSGVFSIVHADLQSVVKRG